MYLDQATFGCGIPVLRHSKTNDSPTFLVIVSLSGTSCILGGVCTMMLAVAVVVPASLVPEQIYFPSSFVVMEVNLDKQNYISKQ